MFCFPKSAEIYNWVFVPIKALWFEKTKTENSLPQKNNVQDNNEFIEQTFPVAEREQLSELLVIVKHSLTPGKLNGK